MRQNSVIASTPMQEAWVINKRNGNCSFTEHKFDLVGITETSWEEFAWLEYIKEVSTHNLFGKGRGALWWHYPYESRMVGGTLSPTHTLPVHRESAGCSWTDGRVIKLLLLKMKNKLLPGEKSEWFILTFPKAPQDYKSYLKIFQNLPKVSLKLPPPVEPCQHRPLSGQRNTERQLNWKSAFASVQAITLIF